MPLTISETDTFDPIVQGPTAGDLMSSGSVRSMGSPLADRSRFVLDRYNEIAGAFVPGGQPTAITASVSANTFGLYGHSLTTGQAIRFTQSTLTPTGTLPGITAGTVYYAAPTDANNFKVSATSGGGAITLSGSLSGTYYVQLVTDAAASLYAPTYGAMPAGTLRSQLATLAGGANIANSTTPGIIPALGGTSYRLLGTTTGSTPAWLTVTPSLFTPSTNGTVLGNFAGATGWATLSNGLAMDTSGNITAVAANGTIVVSSAGIAVGSIAFAAIASKPTTLAGYGVSAVPWSTIATVGTANQMWWTDGSTPAWSSNPTATSLTGTSFLAAGSSLPASGLIRVGGANNSITFRVGSTDYPTVSVDSAGSAQVGNGALIISRSTGVTTGSEWVQTTTVSHSTSGTVSLNWYPNFFGAGGTSGGAYYTSGRIIIEISGGNYGVPSTSDYGRWGCGYIVVCGGGIALAATVRPELAYGTGYLANLLGSPSITNQGDYTKITTAWTQAISTQIIWTVTLRVTSGIGS